MKRTGNQKVVTAAKWLLLAVQRKTPPYCQNPFVKALSAPYRACTALPNKDTALAVTRENRGLWMPDSGYPEKRKAALASSPISNRGIITGAILKFQGGANQIPLCSFQKRKARAMSVRVQICARKIPGMFPLVAMLCKVTFQIEPLKDKIRCLVALPCLCNV